MTGLAVGDITWSLLVSKRLQSTRRYETEYVLHFCLYFDWAQCIELTAGLITLALVEPLPRNVSDRQERPTVEKSVKDAKSLWQTRVRLFSSDFCSSSGYQAAPQGLGGLRLPAEMDHQTCMLQYTELIFERDFENHLWATENMGKITNEMECLHIYHLQLKPDSWLQHRLKLSDLYIIVCSFFSFVISLFSNSPHLPEE